MDRHQNSRLDRGSSERNYGGMWRYFGRIGRGLFAFWIGIAAPGCGQSTDPSPAVAAPSAGAGGHETVAGAGGVSLGGAGGHETVAGAGGVSPGGAAGASQSCALVHHIELPFPVQSLPDTFVVKSGLEFAVSDGLTLSALSWSGELARQLFEREACANTSCSGLFGLTALRAEAGFRLLSLDRPDQGAVVRAWRLGEPGLPEAQPLFGPEFSGLVSSFAVRPSRDGKRALFANGHRVTTQEVTFAVLDADGRVVAPARTLQLPFSLWNGLTVVPTEQAGAISVIADSNDHTQRVWLLRELNSSGQIVFASQVSLPSDYGIRQIVEDDDGYYVALASTTGVRRIGRLLRARPNELVVDEMLLPPGALVGTLAQTLVFLELETAGTSVRGRFLGLSKSVTVEARTLAVVPVEGEPNPRIQLIGSEGNSLFYGFQTRVSQVIEQVTCPETL